MMRMPVKAGGMVPAMSDGDVSRVRALEENLRKLPQAQIPIQHIFHAGVYARTITIKAGVMLTGALIKIPTLLIFNGHADVFTGGDGTVELEGYHVIPAQAGRKQIFYAHADTCLTMLFTTSANTVEEAEKEFTDEWELLMRCEGKEEIIITGGNVCQAG